MNRFEKQFLTKAQKDQIKAEQMANKIDPVINHKYFYDNKLFIIKSYTKLYIIGEELKIIDEYKRNDDIPYIYCGNYTKYFKFSNEVINKKFKMKYSSFFYSSVILNGNYDDNETYFKITYFNHNLNGIEKPNDYSTSLFKNNKIKLEKDNYINKSIFLLNCGMMDRNKEFYRPCRERTLKKMFDDGVDENLYNDDIAMKEKYLKLKEEYDNLI
jgi:hypothetical protein